MNIEVNNTGNNSRIVLGKDAMEKVRQKNDEEKSKEDLIAELQTTRNRNYKLWKVRTWPVLAAAVIVLFVVAGLIYNDYRTETPDETFSHYYKIYSQSKASDSGLDAYMEKDYKTAANHLQDEYVIDGRYLKAIALIEEKEYRNAAAILRNVDTQEGTWLRALCLLRSEQHIEAKSLLEKIYHEKGLFSQEAREILNNHYYGYRAYNQKY